MNTINLQFSELIIIVNTVIRIVTAIIFLLFIIPLQIRESRVKNGLKLLRYQLLVSGIVIFFVNTVGLSIILFKYYVGDTILQSVTDTITVTNSFGFFIIAVLNYQIYHQQYTPENKKRHALIEKMEEAEKRKKVKKK